MHMYDLLAVPENTRIPRADWKLGDAGIEVVFSDPSRTVVDLFRLGIVDEDRREAVRQMLLDGVIDLKEYIRLVS